MTAVKSLLALVVASVGLYTVSSCPEPQEIQVGRYSTMSLQPTEAQKNLFATPVTIQFDESVQSVGEAMRILVERQGIKLTVPESDESPVRTLISLPLPEIHRNLGPINLRQALETLAGPVWRLVYDPVHRLVSFELCGVHEQREDEIE